jgi:hypothetical protein
MEDGDSDAEMADYYGTDSSDDVDPAFDAKARPQQGSTVEIRSRRSHDISARLSHWQVPTSASNLAHWQSREADDSSMFPLSDPE